MKYLIMHDKTKSALEKWAGWTKLLLSSFFFWHSGHELQRSQVGLIRAPPIRLPQKPPRVDTNCPLRNRKHKQNRAQLERPVSQKFFDLKYAFFVDGLDEYSGSHEEIADILKAISQRPNVKVRVSS